MRKLEQSTQFKKDLLREGRGRNGPQLLSELLPVLAALMADEPLDPKYRNHPLTGNDLWDCHVRPDLVLLYLKPDPRTLKLARLGSHSELGL